LKIIQILNHYLTPPNPNTCSASKTKLNLEDEMSSTEAETVAPAPKLNAESSGPITSSQQSVVDVLKKVSTTFFYF
jgi:hypothetical protein